MNLATAMITKDDQGFMFRASHYFLHTIMAIPRSGKLKVYATPPAVGFTSRNDVIIIQKR
jgi:hypothetical protein